ncbi:hypothetical protein PHLGIDRAFT_76434 [Phlebiopsis gigantea 11061_1 CR5-6]|uniref:Uncharacterized protein n=1 Tax=Phlebiopsis gigantea (strain 11061_1 CR5-6) TaxID=745531 RepID=A0A0C3S6J9_PHLG1|nr:hypothetical protein PHLGIDRAFT_76434 [Phlebiopsis gigantea 11061_1 CR5-6]
MSSSLSLSIPTRKRRCVSRRLVCCLVTTAALGLWLLVYICAYPWTWRSRLLASVYTPEPTPPLYARFRAAEAALPQHHVEDPFAGGQRYLFASSHVFWSGWGNYMEDIVLTAHLAQLTNRTHVFNDYIWDVDGPEYTRFENRNWIPNKIPLSAIVSGPIVGGISTGNVTVPRAIHKDYFNKICPQRSVINVDDVQRIAVKGNDYDPYKITQTYLESINELDDPCCTDPHHSAFGNMAGMHALWPTLSTSPYAAQLDWSPLAHSALATNRHLFLPPPPSDDAPLPQRFDGLLVLQLRRGDFESHCADLRGWRADFNAYNRFPGFADPWTNPAAADGGEIEAMYARRCWPSVADVVHKVGAVRRSAAGAGLDSVYVMTNGAEGWAAALEAELGRVFTWARVACSRDAVWTWEERFVAQAMDMLVAERAQVFVGNGFSSMASNVAMLRMAKGFVPDSTTMW